MHAVRFVSVLLSLLLCGCSSFAGGLDVPSHGSSPGKHRGGQSEIAWVSSGITGGFVSWGIHGVPGAGPIGQIAVDPFQVPLPGSLPAKSEAEEAELPQWIQ
jgi:hypothetical protein